MKEKTSWIQALTTSSHETVCEQVAQPQSYYTESQAWPPPTILFIYLFLN